MSDVIVEKDSPFELKRKEDPNQLVAIRTREQVCEDRDVSDGAARLFCRLLDLALNPFHNMGVKGQIIVSQMKLGCMLNCDERSIRRRADELIRGNYIWTSHVATQNTKPITCYHVTAFQPKKQEQAIIPGTGLYGNGRRRFDRGFSRTGKEAAGGQTGQMRRGGGLLVDRFGKQIFFNLLENTAESGQKTPVSPDKIVRCDRTLASSHSGQNCPVTEDTSVLSQRSKLSGDRGHQRRVTTDNSVRHIESPVGDSVPKGVKGKPSPPDLGFEEAIKTMFPSRLAKMRDELRQKATAAKSPEARKEWIRRMKLVEAQLLGGDVPDQAPAPKPARKAPEPVKAKSQEELFIEAQQTINAAKAAGIKPLLSDAHMAALKANGVRL